MAKIGQDYTFYAGNRLQLHIPVVDEDASGSPALSNLDTEFSSVKWALSRFDAEGNVSTTPVIEKKSNVAQAETGGNEIDFSNDVGTNDAADVQLITGDTDALSGDFYHELEGFDSGGQSIVLATGTLTILRNVVNT